jgi:hypothetical protein
MRYEVEVDGNKIEVDGIEFGVANGSSEGNIDLFIRIFDKDEDIYTDPQKKNFWINWLDKCLGTTRDPTERIKSVIATILGGEGDNDPYRTITIQNACISSFNESASSNYYSYVVTLKKAPRKARENLVKVEAQ